MKKILYLLSNIVLSFFIITSDIETKSNDNNGKNYIANLTGKAILLNFYSHNPITKKTIWLGSETIGPLLIAGKAPATATDIITSSMFPAPIDMHPTTCYKVTVDALKINNKKLKDKKIKGCTIPTPGVAMMPRDYKITLEGNQIVVTQLTTRMGIQIPGLKRSASQQWPSEKALAVAKMSPQEKLIYYQGLVTGLTNDIANLGKEIKRMHDSQGNIKAGKLTQVNNRHKMIANKKEERDRYRSRIAKLEKYLAKNKDEKESADFEEDDDIDNADDIDIE